MAMAMFAFQNLILCTKIPMHAVYVGRGNNDTVCVVADDTDIYLSLVIISHHIRSHFYFRQEKTKDKDEVNYHDIRAIAVHLGKNICQILTVSDFTNPFFGSSKIKCWKHQNPTNYCLAYQIKKR